MFCVADINKSMMWVSQVKGHRCVLGLKLPMREIIGAYQVLLGNTNKHPRPL